MNVRLQIGVKAESLLQKSNGTDPECMDVPSTREEQPKVHYNPPHTYTCFGLPYQDHNYVAPPPPTPPASPPQQPPIKVNGHIDIENVSSNTEVTTTLASDEPIYTPDDSITRCVCDFEHDDGYMICCDKCSVWQHIVCMGIDRNNIPDKYLCEKCEPREVNKQKARELQIKKREELAKILYAIDSSATETEDETIRLGINPGRDRQKKSRGKKKKEREKVTKTNAKKAKKLKKDKKNKEKSTPIQKSRKRPKLMSTPTTQNTALTSPESPAAPKTTLNLTNADIAPPISLTSDMPPVPGSTPPTATAKRANRRNSLKSPKSPLKACVKSPIVKVLSAKSPLKSPKSPIKSQVKSPIKSPVKSPVKSQVKTAQKSPAKSPQGKTISSINLNENALDSWDSHLPEGYEVAKTNQYTQDIVQILASKKLNGQHAEYEASSKPCHQLLDQLCRVAQVNKNSKGLEATEDLKSDLAIIEYTGKVMLREQYDKENIFFRRLQPFVLFYSDFEHLDLCVNAESYGNDARYIRRSCTPNAKVLHVVENGNVLFFIYSQKDIAKGAEITIPFDFDYQESNYDVECACSKPSCPVVKFYQKKEEIKLNKKKRSARLSHREKRLSVSAEESSSNIDVGTSKPNTAVPSTPTASITTAPVNIAPVAEGTKPTGPPHKRRRLVSVTVEPICKETRELRRKSTTNKDEERIEEPKALPPTPLSPCSTTMESEDEGIASDRRKKMTREERKMEAIMKAFEKLEKREERRKEALARLEHTKKPEKIEKESKESKEAPKPFTEKVDVIEEPEKSPPPPLEIKPKLKTRKKTKHGMAQRRGSRVNSSASGNSSAADPPSSADESSNQAAPQTPASAPPALGETNQTLNTPSTPSSGQQGKAFRFPKTKKHLMNEWLSEKAHDLQKPLTIKTEALDLNPVSETTDRSADFVKCVPSPHATPLSHLRRSSFSGTHTPKSFSTPSPVQLDCNLGSAKKRWLRQAMFESTTCQPGAQQSPSGSMSPVPNGGMSPNPSSCTNSPGASPHIGHNIADFVTPLKKRRLARESISLDTPPYPPTPSTPTPVSSDIQIHESNRVDLSNFTSIKFEDSDNRGLNGFRTHFSSTVQGLSANQLFEGLGEDSPSCPSTSELLLTSSGSTLTRERHSSGRSDYRSEADTDTEDSRPDDGFRQNHGSDAVGSSRGLEMLTQIALQSKREKTEDSLTINTENADTSVCESGYKIELKPEVAVVRPTSLFPPFLFSPSPKSNPTETFKSETETCIDSSQRTKEFMPQEFETKESVVKYGSPNNYESPECESPLEHNGPVKSEAQDSGLLRPETLPATPSKEVAEEKVMEELNSSCEMDTSFEEGQGASLDPDFGTESVNNIETCPIWTSKQNVNIKKINSGLSPDTVKVTDNCVDDSEDTVRSQLKKETSFDVLECDREIAIPIQQEDSKRGEVESSTSEHGVQKHYIPDDNEVKPPSSNSADSRVSSHADTSEAFVVKELSFRSSESAVTSHTDTVSNMLIPLASSSCTMPTQSDAQIASRLHDSDHDYLDGEEHTNRDTQDQSPMSSNGLMGKSREGEVSSLVEEGPVMSRNCNNEQASLYTVAFGGSADSSNKDSKLRKYRPPTSQELSQHHQHKQRRNSIVETLVSCSSDTPVFRVNQEAEASTSTAGRGVTAEDYELEEGECISDTEEEEEEVTSMEASVGSKLQSFGAEVSSSKEDRIEENMEVDVPDQSFDGELSDNNQCHVVSTGKEVELTSAALPDTATHLDCWSRESSTQQEPHSATTTESPPQSQQIDEAIDSTSGIVNASQSKLREATGSVVGDVSSSSTTSNLQNPCEGVRGTELMPVDSKGEEPSPSTSNMGNDMYFSSRDNSMSPSEVETNSACNSHFLHCTSMEGNNSVFESPVTNVSANGSISSSSSSPVQPSAGSATSLHLHSNSSSASSTTSIVSTSPSISPTGIAPSSSTSVKPVLQPTPTKKRVSLLEYRKRMKQKGLDVTPTQPSSTSSSSSSISPSPVISSSNRRDPRSHTIVPLREQSDSPPTLAPLPLFDNLRGGRESQLPKGGRSLSEDEEVDSRWNTAATSVERIREQSIAERLRREFGVDAADESSEDDERTKERRRLAAASGALGGSGASSPPPPPPPSTAPPPHPPATNTGGDGSSTRFGGPLPLPHHGGLAPHQRTIQPPPTHPSMMPVPHLPLQQAPLNPAPLPSPQQGQQQQQSSGNSIPSLMAIPSYTTKHYREKRSGGTSSNFSYPPPSHGHGNQYAPPPQASSQFNNITITPTQPPQQYQRGGNKPQFGNKHHPPGPPAPHHAHHSQPPPPPPPPPPPSSSNTQPTQPPPPNPHPSGAYAAAYTAVPTPSRPQFNSGVLPPPPPPRYNQGYPQQPHPPPPPPPPHGKIIRDYHHKH